MKPTKEDIGMLFSDAQVLLRREQALVRNSQLPKIQIPPDKLREHVGLFVSIIWVPGDVYWKLISISANGETVTLETPKTKKLRRYKAADVAYDRGY